MQALAEAEARRVMSEQARTNYNETYAERARQMEELAGVEETLRKAGIDLAAAEQGLYTSFAGANSQIEGTAKSAHVCSGDMLALIGTYRELKGSVAETEAELQKNLDIMAEAASVEEAGAEAYRLMAEEGLSLSEAVDLVAGSLDKELVAQAAAAQAGGAGHSSGPGPGAGRGGAFQGDSEGRRRAHRAVGEELRRRGLHGGLAHLHGGARRGHGRLGDEGLRPGEAPGGVRRQDGRGHGEDRVPRRTPSTPRA